MISGRWLLRHRIDALEERGYDIVPSKHLAEVVGQRPATPQLRISDRADGDDAFRAPVACLAMCAAMRARSSGLPFSSAVGARPSVFS
jgi:hypothetical protein